MIKYIKHMLLIYKLSGPEEIINSVLKGENAISNLKCNI